MEPQIEARASYFFTLTHTFQSFLLALNASSILLLQVPIDSQTVWGQLHTKFLMMSLLELARPYDDVILHHYVLVSFPLGPTMGCQVTSFLLY